MAVGIGWLGKVGVCIRTNEAVRHAVEGDLEQLLELYQHLHRDEPLLAIDNRVRQLWSEMLADDKMHVLLTEEGGALVSSCTLTVITNLTRCARPYGLMENVVTHSDHRRRGYGKRVVEGALKIAWETECYKVMLLTGNESAVQFYEKCGFVQGIKTGLVAYPNGL